MHDKSFNTMDPEQIRSSDELESKLAEVKMSWLDNGSIVLLLIILMGRTSF